MQLVQLVLTDDQALLTRQLIDLALSNSTEDQVGEVEADAQRLAVFFGAIAADPDRFPVSGRMATAMKRAKRRAKGPAQPQSRRNKRKARQEKRMSFHKRRRKERREFAEAYNAAREAMEAEQREMEEAYQEMRARLEAEPKFDITDAAGNVILAGVPQSMVRPVEAAMQEEAEVFETDAPKIILPGSAEAIQAQIEAKS
jgi:hypothetical protein